MFIYLCTSQNHIIMNILKTTLFAILVVLGLAACGGDDEPNCKSCSAEAVTTIDGEVFATQTISAQQFCDEALEQVEGEPLVVEQTAGGITQSITTTYNCN